MHPFKPAAIMHSHIFLPALPPHIAVLIPGLPPAQIPQLPPAGPAATAHATAVESDSKAPPAFANRTEKPPLMLVPVTRFPGNVVFIARALTQPQTLHREFRQLAPDPAKSAVVARAVKRKYKPRVQKARRERAPDDPRSSATPLLTLATLATATAVPGQPSVQTSSATDCDSGNDGDTTENVVKALRCHEDNDPRHEQLERK